MVKRDGREGKEGSTLEMNTIKENIIYSNNYLTFFCLTKFIKLCLTILEFDESDEWFNIICLTSKKKLVKKCMPRTKLKFSI